MRREATTADTNQEIARAVQGMQRALDVLVAALDQKQQKPAAPPPASKVEPTKAAAVKPQGGGRGRPPPPEFDFDKLPDGQLLTETEAAAVGRWSTNSLSTWRQIAGHPLRWQIVGGGRVRYAVRDVREFIASGYRGRGRPPIGNVAMTGAECARRHRLQHRSVPKKTKPAPAQDDRAMQLASGKGRREADKFEEIGKGSSSPAPHAGRKR